jgi:predicted Zn-dependent protease
VTRRPAAAPGGRPALALALIAAAAAAATPALAAAPMVRAPGDKPLMASEEGGMWSAADKAEAHVKTSAELDTDPAINAYVGQVVCKVAVEYCGELRAYVLDRPVFNAAAAPNGYVEVNSGLLLRAASEDELGFVLGHEVSHFARNHSLQSFHTAKMTADTMMVLSLAVAAAGAAASYSSAASASSPAAAQSQINNISAAARGVNDLIYLAGVASFFSFSREQEGEADQLGFARAQKAGYAPGAPPAMWRALLEEHQASDFPAVRKSDVSGSIFRSHPITIDRINALTSLAPSAAPADIAARQRYRAIIRPHLNDWLKDDLRRRDYGQTLYVLNRLRAEGEDLGLIEYYRGEAYRLRRDEGDAALALAAYQVSITYPDAPAAAWRELGDARTKAADKTGAALAYQAYLDHAPTAQDRWLVEANLKSLQPQGGS